MCRAADVLCHPTRREGIPNVVREAMVAGMAVVATAASGTPEIVTHGETGLLSPVNDEAALRANLKRVLEEPDLRARLGRAGRERALREFTEEQCARRWVELFERLRA
jgi:glycosyltransferase involved in cell wall biosynthesis